MFTDQICTCIGLTIHRDVKLSAIVHPGDQAATLVIGNSMCEAWFDKPSLEKLRDLADDSLRKLQAG